MRKKPGEGKGDTEVNKTIKRRITRCVILLAAIVAVVFVSGLIRSFIRAETTAVKIESNAEYFSGTTNMGAAEITRTSANTVYGVIDFTLTVFIWLLAVLLAYNGAFAVYKYFKAKEKKNEKS
jgi:hypothetical protein